MNRSKTQITTSYSPGSLFTYEGGLGCCVSIPKAAPYTVKSPAVPRQLFEILDEFVSNWFERASSCRQQPPVLPQQCLEDVFLDYKMEPRVDSDRFVLTEPSRIGFMPDPLVFSCAECGLVTEFKDVVDLERRWKIETRRVDCPKSSSKLHRFRQLDVVFAHWSGNYAGLSPSRFLVDANRRVNSVTRCKACDNEEYRLLKNGSSFFGDWAFQCTKCLTTKEIVREDRETLELLWQGHLDGLGNQKREWNMLPVSYRASSVHYTQRETFIIFNSSESTGVLTASRRADLVAQIMTAFDFPGTALSHDEIVRQLRANGRAKEADDYEQLFDILTIPGLQEHRRAALEKVLAEKNDQFQSSGLIAKQRVDSPILVGQILDSQSWARRYNPIRLTVEHASLVSESISREGTDPTLPAISVKNPETCFIDEDDISARQQYSAFVTRAFDQLGVDDVVLLRGLDICEFSFGYTRVSSTPVTKEKDLDMPVRLKAFEAVDRNKRPIYVLEQKNEAFYVRLNEARVVAWLESNGLASPFTGGPGRVGGAYLTEYQDFGPFLEDYKERSSESSVPRQRPSYIYLLLHTFAHHFAQALVEYSGLEQGSLGEYIFPADLSFLVYRRGMTPDLGNLSAMWRNHGTTILEELLSDRKLRCDSGSLCDQRGAACPACIMSPEVSCLAGNNLLCRSTLRGGSAPGWDTVKSPIQGYFRSQRA
jgi:hypothetical protein